MEKKVLKLGLVCTDLATGLEGTLTLLCVYTDETIRYVFQPKGLDDEGQPVKRLVLEKERLAISDPDRAFEMIEIPVEILRTQVESKSTGFKGMAVKLIRHINGCFHIAIQPAGVAPKTRSAIDENDFDVRDCKGDAILDLTPEELKESKEDTPSPSQGSFRERIPG